MTDATTTVTTTLDGATLDGDSVRSTALLLGPLLFGILQQLITEPAARTWHRKLNKSPYRPPCTLFPLIWTWSYLSLGYASYLVFTDMQGTGIALSLLTIVYGGHLMLLNLWNVIFFSMRRIDYALNCLLLVDMTASILLVCTWALVPFAAALCLPYFCWLLELTYLNIYMFRNNVAPHLIDVTKYQVLHAYNYAGNEEEDNSCRRRVTNPNVYENHNSQVVPQFKSD